MLALPDPFEPLSSVLMKPTHCHTHLMAIVVWNHHNHLPLAQVVAAQLTTDGPRCW